MGVRHGHRERTLTGTFGKTRIAVPRARLTGEDGKDARVAERVAARLPPAARAAFSVGPDHAAHIPVLGEFVMHLEGRAERKRLVAAAGEGEIGGCVNRRPKLTPDRRPNLTPLAKGADGSARPGGAGRGCAAGASAVR